MLKRCVGRKKALLAGGRGDSLEEGGGGEVLRTSILSMCAGKPGIRRSGKPARCLRAGVS